MSGPPLHPFAVWQFYRACLGYAFSGAWGMTGHLSTLGGLLPGAFKTYWPSAYTKAALWLTSHRMGEDLLWKVPVGVGLAILLVRIIAAPFVIYRSGVRAQAAPDMSSLHVANTNLTNKVLELESQRAAGKRHLSEIQAGAMTNILRSGYGQLRANLISHQIATAEELDAEPLSIRLISLGDGLRTYRKELAAVFAASGFAVVQHEMMSQGQDEAFFDAVTVVHGSPTNTVRPFVIDSFKAAGIPYREGDGPTTNLFFGPSVDPRSISCTIVIG